MKLYGDLLTALFFASQNLQNGSVQPIMGIKKLHALKFQAVMFPNGMFGHLFGPEEGRHNDHHLLAKSSFLNLCAQHAIHPGTNNDDLPHIQYLQIFGDPVGGVSNQIISPYAGARERTAEVKEWHVEMASVRIEVEHGFGNVANTWPFLNAGWKMHVYHSPVGRYYWAGVLFTNANNCMRYNQVAQYFDCEPPTLLEYFHD